MQIALVNNYKVLHKLQTISMSRKEIAIGQQTHNDSERQMEFSSDSPVSQYRLKNTTKFVLKTQYLCRKKKPSDPNEERLGKVGYTCSLV